jgi:T-complex protein 1 subunit eta
MFLLHSACRRLPQIGADRYNLFTGCAAARTATLILRGGAEQFIDETERSIHDAVMIVKSSIRGATRVVAGERARLTIFAWSTAIVCCS